jgi:hypothetical protein
MGVGLDGTLLTTYLYPFTRSMVPYSGDGESCLPRQNRGSTRPRFDAGLADWLEF